jgi:hypothetical protein
MHVALRNAGYVLRFWFLLSVALAVSSVAERASAATRYWAGGTSGRWEVTSSWASIPRGPGGASIPGANDLAILNFSGGTVTLRSNVRIGGLLLANTWTGSLNLGTGALSVGNLTEANGGGIRIGSGRLLQIGGTSGNVTSSGALTMTGGIASFQGTFTLSGSLSVTDGADAGRPSFTSTGTLVFDGIADQNFTGSGRIMDLNNLTLENSGGGTSDDIIVDMDWGPLELSGALTITQGNLDLTTNSVAFIVDDGDITLANDTQASLTTNSNVSHSGSLTVNAAAAFAPTAGTWTVISDNTDTYTLTGGSGGGKRFYNLTLSNTGPSGNRDLVIAGAGLNLSGALTVNTGRLDLTTNSQALNVDDGDITLANDSSVALLTDSNVSHSGSLTVNAAAAFAPTAGTWTVIAANDVTYTLNGGGKRFSGLTLNNTGGGTADDVTVAGGGLYLSGALMVTQGNLDLAANDQVLSLEGNFTLADNAQASFASDANIFAAGNVTVNDASAFTISGVPTFTLNGSSQSVNFDSRPLHTLHIASGTTTLTGHSTIGRQVTIGTGTTLALGSNAMYATGAIFLNYATLTEGTGKLVHTGSTFLMTDQNYAFDDAFITGESIFVTLTDSDENINGTAADTVTVTVSLTGDSETVTLTETNNTSGIFRGSIRTSLGAQVASDALLQANTFPVTVTASYTDAQDGFSNSDTAALTSGLSTSGSSSGGAATTGGGGGRRSVNKLSPQQTKALEQARKVRKVRRALSPLERKSKRQERLKEGEKASTEAQERRVGEKKKVTPLLERRRAAEERLKRRLERRGL